MTPDCASLAGCADISYLFVSPHATTPGTGGYLSCPQTGAIEVQYIVSDTWAPLTHEGQFEAQ